MDMKTIIANLSAVATATTQLEPLLAAMGIPSGALALANAGLQIAEEVNTAISNGTAIATAKEQSEIDTLIVGLQARADALSKEVDAS